MLGRDGARITARGLRDGNKTDRSDTNAVLEASRNRDIDAVPVKTEEQQATMALHRLRQGYLRTLTARINAVRGHLRESGINIPAGAGPSHGPMRLSNTRQTHACSCPCRG